VLLSTLFLLGLEGISAELEARVKTWQKNTNFDDMRNWRGYEGNCSKNIYSFPSDMEPTVISLPANTTILAKEIILPRKGHLVFQQGSTTLFNSPSDTCHGVGEDQHNFSPFTSPSSKFQITFSKARI
jgi:hypothetical protein